MISWCRSNPPPPQRAPRLTIPTRQRAAGCGGKYSVRSLVNEATMTDSQKRPRKSRASRGSLLSQVATGGVAGGKGFDFQTRYAACHLPLWLLKGSFHQLFFEGTGDIDIRFIDQGKSSRTHIQVKDHEVSPSELKVVIEHFQNLDSGFP